jgi:hypothetical protein
LVLGSVGEELVGVLWLEESEIIPGVEREICVDVPFDFFVCNSVECAELSSSSWLV